MTLGHILHLQRLSTEDGPGIRTTVFFKGCPLACAWCHNPEAISTRLQIQWFAERCLGCRTCVGSCPSGCLAMTDAGLSIDRVRCDGCAACSLACPAGALQALGRLITAEELVTELVKDRAYYAASGGGVTLSGGEPTMQPEFAEEVLRGLHAAGIRTALDTCGLCSPATLDRLLPHTDLVLFDLKLMDSAGHQKWTGAPNARILENLRQIVEVRGGADRPMALWIRTPLIPGVTDAAENLTAIGEYLIESCNGRIERWELCAFNNLCRDQYRRLGQDWAFAETPLMSAEELQACEAAARSSGLEAPIAATGAARLAEVPVE